MGVTQYIGARYVPLFADPAEWNNTRTYEPLTIVLHEGNSFTSKQFVPVGIDIDNNEFWAETGNYNAQVEAYRREVLSFDDRINAVEEDALAIKENVDKQGILINAMADYSTNVREVPYGSFQLRDTETMFFGAGAVCEYKDFLVFEACNARDGNNIERFYLVNKLSECITYKEVQYAPSMHSRGMFVKNDKIYNLFTDRSIAVFDGDLQFTNPTIINIPIPLGSITVDENGTIYGYAAFSGVIHIYRFADDLQTFEELHQVKINAGNMQTQSCKIKDGFIYIAVINSIIKINIETGKIAEIMNSMLREGEYEDCIFIDGKLYVLINCGNTSPGAAIAGLTTANTNNLMYPNGFAFHASLFVNSSRNGFYENGSDASPIHSSMWASFLAISYYRAIALAGDTNHLFLPNWSGHIRGNNHTLKMCGCNCSQIYFENCVVIDPGMMINPNDKVFRNCDIMLRGGSFTSPTNTYDFACCTVRIFNTCAITHVNFSSCKFIGRVQYVKASLTIYDNETGITGGGEGNFSSPNFNASELAFLFGNTIAFEIATESGGAVNAYAIGYRFNAHTGSLFAFGVTDTGKTVNVNISATRLARCYVDGQDAYVKCIYPMPN